MKQIIQEYNNIFWNMIKCYDLNDNNVLRKLIHSFDVAKLCFELACYEKFNIKERNLCYLMGLLHDLGRFEQWLKFKTYDDAKSVDHGDISFEMLNNLNCSKIFSLSDAEKTILNEAIKFHTKPYDGKNKKIIKFNMLLKDADAFSNVITTANGMQQMTVQKNGFTAEILNAFYNRELLRPFSPQTKLDRCLTLVACCYYVRHPYLRKKIIECNYIDIMFETFSKYLINTDKKIFKDAINNLKKNYI